MQGPLMIALDVPNEEEMNAILDQFELNDDLTVKIGMELFYGNGPAIVKNIKNRGYKVFLDLKLFDIPNTVKRAMKQIAKLKVDYVTVHALGGSKMIRSAKEGLSEVAYPTKLLAVTELTSLSEKEVKEEQNCNLSMSEQVVHLGQLAKSAGADGVITSVHEVKVLRNQLGDDFLYVTPGIRNQNDAVGDQTRVSTPKVAYKSGSSALVVGRPITQSKNPRNSYLKMLKEWNNER
ncbi:orotidine-5'-phosphate decarboxylase [Lactobacillus sp. S2-2]|uniref:orotidine-5'-phosphate decarboxylase n=1 Tax=Lactobacillus sp. S2-2 TaxID=2692917 RepID=UPI001F0293A4|nr:orotidine-5'-phosphate decarboxylase [Lactobacillus sp. S2-2]MCF6514917.1 orotidine-5'-phosphate decarboxylase [Lactobacillus sp. S2-2]